MIYYTLTTSTSFTSGEAVQLNGTTLETHSTGNVIGVVMSSVSLNDENTEYATKVYAAGGGGVDMLLGASWDGYPSRFEFIGGRAHPVASGGDGWLIPEFPISAKVSGDIAQGGIYK